MRTSLVHLCLVTLLTGFCVSRGMTQVKMHPMDAASGVGSSGSDIGSVLPSDVVSCNIAGHLVRIYQAGENTGFLPDDQKTYYFEVGHRIANARLCRNVYPQRIEFDCVPTPIEVLDVYTAVRNSLNPYVSPAHVMPLPILGIEVTYPGAVPFRSDLGASVSMDGAFSAYLEFKNGRTSEEFKNILSGSKVGITYTVNVKGSGVRAQLKLLRNDLANSSVERDFFSQVEGNTVWALQARTAMAALKKELRIKCNLEGDNERVNRIFSDVWERILPASDTIVITFEDLAQGAGAARQLVDFSKDTRFATDKLTKVAYDARNMSDHQWNREYGQQLKDAYEKYHRTKRSGQGDFSVFGIFSLGGGGGSEVDDNYMKEWESIVNSKDSGRRLFERSFRYEEEGERYIPKGIIAYENIRSTSEAIQDYDVDVNYYSYEVRKITRQMGL